MEFVISTPGIGICCEGHEVMKTSVGVAFASPVERSQERGGDRPYN